MKSSSDIDVCVTGIGVLSALGQGKEALTEGLYAGRNAFDVMRRAGRQTPASAQDEGSAFIGAEIDDFALPEGLGSGVERTASLSARLALAALDEAWQEASLDAVAGSRIGLVVGGSNLQQRELVQAHERYRDTPHFVRPTYAMTFLDSDLCGVCTQAFGIRGFAYTLGGASASGQLAVLQAAEAVRSGRVDVAIALGAMMDLSYWECLALRSAGAMGSTRFGDTPAMASRPFDAERDGFIFGEGCAALVLERGDLRPAPATRPYAQVLSGVTHMDGNRNPNPSVDGEVEVIQAALREARLASEDIAYVNPHGTGSTLGDTTEIEAIKRGGLGASALNATKSVLGHALTAAGAIEIAATLLQMRDGHLHGSRNLEDPIDAAIDWVPAAGRTQDVEHALTLSMGFGGTNSAMCWRRCH